MLQDIRYDDMEVVHLLTLGTKVVGELPRTGIWRPYDQRPRCSTGAVLAGAKAAKEKLKEHRGQNVGGDKISEEVRKATEEDSNMGIQCTVGL